MALETIHLGSASYQNKVETDRRQLARVWGARVGKITGFTASTPAGMNLGLTAGEAIIGGKSAPTTQGSYFFSDTASAVVAWPAAAASPRIDALVAVVGDSQYGVQPLNGPRWLVVQGTPAGSPTAPLDATIQAAVGPGAWERALEVLVPVGASTLLPGNITTKWSTLLPYVIDDVDSIDRTRTIIKSADETVTSSVALQNDDELKFSVVAGRKYVFEFVLQTTGAQTGDIEVGLTGPTGVVAGMAFGMAPSATTGSENQGNWIGFGALTDFAGRTEFGTGTGAGTGVRIKGSYQPTADGVVQLQWAQNTSSATATAVKAGSLVEWRRVA